MEKCSGIEGGCGGGTPPASGYGEQLCPRIFFSFSGYTSTLQNHKFYIKTFMYYEWRL